METAEDLVVRHLELWGFRCKRFSKGEMRSGKTPDRRVYRGDQLAFFLEVKEISRNDWLGGVRPDPRFNRLTSDIHDAVQQFDSVNPDREHPNVLALVNKDSECDSRDLIGVLTGYASTSDGGTLRIYAKQAFGRIRNEKHRIDAYLWFDRGDTHELFVNASDLRHLDRLQGYLGTVFTYKHLQLTRG